MKKLVERNVERFHHILNGFYSRLAFLMLFRFVKLNSKRFGCAQRRAMLTFVSISSNTHLATANKMSRWKSFEAIIPCVLNGKWFDQCSMGKIVPRTYLNTADPWSPERSKPRGTTVKEL